MAAITRTSADRDLLVRVDTKLDLVSIQLNEVRTQMAGKADHSQIDPRITKLERNQEVLLRNMYMVGGGLVVLELLLKFLLR